MNELSRRRFLQAAALSGVASISLEQASFTAAADPPTAPKIGAFTKSFQEWSIPRVCRSFVDVGLDGLDLTVRPGGHIEPDQVEQLLPQARAAAKEAGTEILFLTTGITDANAEAEKLLATAAESGIRKVKLGYYRYDQFGTLAKEMKAVRKRIEEVIRLASRYDVLPCIHIHSGRFIPSHGTMLYQLIRDISPEEVGAYVDPLHMAKEGGGEGWRQGLDLLGPWIALCSVKNCAWERAERDEEGQQRWKTLTVPSPKESARFRTSCARWPASGFADRTRCTANTRGLTAFVGSTRKNA